MSTEKPTSESPHEGDPQPGEAGRISFVQRLQRELGGEVDPAIVLHGEEDAGEPEGDSSAALGLYKKLSEEPTPENRYAVRSEVGKGGMGTVFRVWDGDLRRNLAMKVMHKKIAGVGDSDVSSTEREKLGRFLEEAQITGQLDHPGIVPVHDLGIGADGRIYFTMRLVRGRDLKEILDLARKGEEGWTRTKALQLILKVCEAMAFAHSKGVVHRDLKPSNIMVGRFGETYVMDWGLARVLGRRDSHDVRLKPADGGSHLSLVRTVRKDDKLLDPESPLVTMDGDVVGTPSYMALEQAQGRLDEIGPRSDVFSLGGILYYMLTGRAPYVEEGERVSPHTVLSRVLAGPPIPIEKLAPDAPEELVAICSKAMTRQPENRYASMLEVAEDIQAYLENRVVSAYEGGSFAEFRKWVVRNRGMAAALAGLILIGLSGALYFAWLKSAQVTELAAEKGVTEEAEKRALGNLEKANRHAQQAQTNLELATEKTAEANRNAEQARTNEQLSRRSGYMANLVAAEYSLRIHEVEEARRLLDSCDPDLRGWEWKHLDLRAHAALRTFRPGRSFVTAVEFLPDGKSVATLTRAGQLVLFDVTSGERMAPDNVREVMLDPFEIQPPRRLDVSPDGTRIALVGRDASVRVYAVSTGAVLLEATAALLPGTSSAGAPGTARSADATGVKDDRRATCVAYAPDGGRLAVGFTDGTVGVLDGGDGSQLACALVHPLGAYASPSSEVAALAWSLDGAWLVSASRDHSVRVLDQATLELLQELSGHQGEVLDVAWDSTGTLLASASEDRSVRLWRRTESGLVHERMIIDHEQAVTAVDFHPSSPVLLTSSRDEKLRLFDLAIAGPEGMTVLADHDEPVFDAVFSPDGTLLASGSADTTVKLWDARGESFRTPLVQAGEIVTAMTLDPSGARIAYASFNSSVVRVVDAHTGQTLVVMRGHERNVIALDWSRDGRFVLTGAGDATARIWDAESGRQLTILRGHELAVTCVVIAPDGTWCATGSMDRRLRVWSTDEGALLHVSEPLSGSANVIEDLAISPAGDSIAVASADKRIPIFGKDLAEPLRTLVGHTKRVAAVAFTPDGRFLLSGSNDETARLWNLATGETIALLEGHEDHVLDVGVAPDGSRFATASRDHSVRIWDRVSGKTLLTLRGHASTVRSVAFTEQGDRLVSLCSAGASTPGDQGNLPPELWIWESGDVEGRRARWLAGEEMQGRARTLIDLLYVDYFLQAEVLARLQSDATLAPELRDAALRMARVRGEDLDLLDAATRTVVLRSDASAEEYAVALRRAQAACALAPEEKRLACTLGMAQFRAKLYPIALSTLDGIQRLEKTREAITDTDETLASLFEAMAQRELGSEDEARNALGRAREQIEASDEVSGWPPIHALLAEAQGMIEPEGTPRSGS